MSVQTAMVMAAGHGTRMRPLTNERPKALVEVGGRTLIDHMLDRLLAAGVRRAVVNVHAFADRLEAHLAGRCDLEIVISDEREALLETGGGVVKARALLGEAPVLICNIDAVWVEWEPVLAALLAAWDPAAMDELFLLADRASSLGYTGRGDFELDPEEGSRVPSHVPGRVRRRTGERATWVYAGVEVFKPQLVDGLATERFSRNRVWDGTLARGRVRGLPLPGYWMHVGDPEARRAAEAVLRAA